MKKIIGLIDYKKRFGTKYTAVPYRSGMDLNRLSDLFKKYGYNIIYKHFYEINFSINKYQESIILYTSSEDEKHLYKNYINDILYGLYLQGAFLIPDYFYFLAHDNKVFMEILRSIYLKDIEGKHLKVKHYGNLEEVLGDKERLNFPVILKKYSGAMSKNVSLAKNRSELIKQIKKNFRTSNVFTKGKDFLRTIKHKGYMQDSIFQTKFVLQEFIPNLSNDWKVLVFGEKYYVLERGVKKNDFRASGSGNFEFKREIDSRILDYAKTIFELLNVPNLSLDIAFDRNSFYLFEFQTIYFGTTTIEKSPFYFENINDSWVLKERSSTLEEEYVNSIVIFINNTK